MKIFRLLGHSYVLARNYQDRQLSLTQFRFIQTGCGTRLSGGRCRIPAPQRAASKGITTKSDTQNAA